MLYPKKNIAPPLRLVRSDVAIASYDQAIKMPNFRLIEKENMTTDVAIALGSNLGNSLQTLEDAIQILAQQTEIELIAKSAWYRTKPIGPPQPDYINGCITCRVNLTAENLLEILLETEQIFGRQRKEHWGARTLDLDLLLYSTEKINLPHLQIPHPRMNERAFVLVPLAEIAADWLEPHTNQTIEILKNQLDLTGIQCMISVANS